MKIIISSLLLSIFLTVTSYNQTKDPIKGWLHTSGNLILDSTNNPILLTGINSTGMEWGAGHAWNRDATPGCSDAQYGCYQTPFEQQLPQEFDDIKSWGFNFVRFLISWANLEPNAPVDSSGIIVHHWNQKYLDSLDMIISQFSNNGIGILISLHQWTWSPVFSDTSGVHGLGMPVWLYDNQSGITQSQAANQFFVKNTEILPGYNVQQGYIDAWKEIVKRYVNNPTVFGADLFNEPPDQINFNLKKYYDTVGTAIHSVNPNLLLVFQDAVNGKFKLTGAQDIPNSVYSFHMYPKAWLMPGLNQPSAKDQMTEHLDSAKAWNVPMFIGEFGQFGFADSLGWEADMKMMLDFCKQNNISWTFYSYQHWKHALVQNGQVNDTLVQVLQYGMNSNATITKEKINPTFTFQLNQNYPNPFNPSTIIEYTLSKDSFVSLKIFDILGNVVANLENKEEAPGNYKIEFDNKNLASGIYLYQLKAGDFIQTKKLVLMK